MFKSNKSLEFIFNHAYKAILNTLDEHKTLDEGQLSDEIVKYKNILEKEKSDLFKIRKEYNEYNDQLDKREKTLQEHIKSISNILVSKDINQVKNSLLNQQDQIQDNIRDLEKVKKNEILIKKRDLEERLSMRLIDSKMRFEDILREKIQEKEDLVKRSEKINSDLERINSNFEAILDKANKASNEGYVMRLSIQNMEQDNTSLKKTLLSIQSEIVRIKEKIAALKRRKTRLWKLKLDDRNSIYDKKQMTADNNKECKFNEIIKLLSDEEYIKSNPRSSIVLSNLYTTYESNKAKIKSISHKIEKLEPNYMIRNRVYEIINSFKHNTMDKTWSHFVTPSKEERGFIIESLLNDKILKELIN
jgi:chromosome segregation ATPase